jgi:predicted ABC-type ATPase
MAGPNGAGKTTGASALLQEFLTVDEFINADAIAQALSTSDPDSMALEAGRIMLKRLKELADQRANFAFETTLASRTFAPWLKKLTTFGYESHLNFFTLPDAETAIARVATRVTLGGHNVPEVDIRRRFTAGLENFFNLYMPQVTDWRLFDNTNPDNRVIIAQGGAGYLNINQEKQYAALVKEYAHAR